MGSSKIQVGDCVKFQLPLGPKDKWGETGEKTRAKLPDGFNASDQGFTLADENGIKICFVSKGEVVVPALQLMTIEESKALEVWGYTQPSTFQVASSILPSASGTPEPSEIRGPVALKFPALLVTAFAILIAFIASLITYALIKFKRKGKPVVVAETSDLKIQINPHDEALAALLQLESQNNFERAQFKVHCFLLSDILKKFFGRCFSFDAQESTTGEFFNKLEPFRNKMTNFSELESLFEKLDRVKFTDFEPDSSFGRVSIEVARKIIEGTKG